VIGVPLFHSTERAKGAFNHGADVQEVVVNLWAVEAHSEVVTPIEALRVIGSINAKRGLIT
jgi:hypothetical protein